MSKTNLILGWTDETSGCAACSVPRLPLPLTICDSACEGEVDQVMNVVETLKNVSKGIFVIVIAIDDAYFSVRPIIWLGKARQGQARHAAPDRG